jgi:hypothetical protein
MSRRPSEGDRTELQEEPSELRQPSW